MPFLKKCQIRSKYFPVRRLQASRSSSGFPTSTAEQPRLSGAEIADNFDRCCTKTPTQFCRRDALGDAHSRKCFSLNGQICRCRTPACRRAEKILLALGRAGQSVNDLLCISDS